jgi:hypothetical protein
MKIPELIIAPVAMQKTSVRLSFRRIAAMAFLRQWGFLLRETSLNIPPGNHPNKNPNHIPTGKKWTKSAVPGGLSASPGKNRRRQPAFREK